MTHGYKKKMYKTVGVCGYVATGSSAFSDFLREFDDVQVLDFFEFLFAYVTDGLEDLEYHLNNYHKFSHSVVAIERFRKLMKINEYNRLYGKNFYKTTNAFIKNIIQFSWRGYSSLVDQFVCSKGEQFLKKYIFKLLKTLKNKKILGMYARFFTYNMELSIMPEDFEKEAHIFISHILDVMGRDRQRITVLDQPFEASNPVKSFKFFDNPKAIVVDRDPRDHYLFVKNFLRPRGIGYQVPCNNVDDYIKYFRLVHQSPFRAWDRDDVIHINFESFIYDYENTKKKIMDFVEITNHVHKGIYFKPTHSRNNTQLFKKYIGFESDIMKIEKELPEYIFHFDNFPNVKEEGSMFWGSQNRKGL